MKTIVCIFIISLFVGCDLTQTIESKQTPLLRTRASSVQYSMLEDINLEELGIIKPSKIVHKDSLIVFLTPKSKYRFAIYNTNSQQLTQLVPAGNKEGEGLYFLDLNLSGTIVSAFDFCLGRLVEIDLGICNSCEYKPLFTTLKEANKIPLGGIRINNKVITTGIYTKGRYCCSNLDSNIDTYSVSYPTCTASNLTDSLKSIFYASNCLAVNPEMTRMACANMQHSCLDICNINDSLLTRINEIHLTQPNVLFQQNRWTGQTKSSPVAYLRYNLFGFCDLTVSDEYIYALYSGRSYDEYGIDIDKGRVIFIFDWTGHHVRTLHIPISCSSISYDSNSDIIYALAHENGHSEIITINPSSNNE